MNFAIEPYRIDDPESIESPGIVIFLDLARLNIETMISITGSPQRLRPHCKTHKTREIVRMMLERGISRHKCATIAEAEMLFSLGATDVFLACQPVGPNVARVRQLLERFPDGQLSIAIDHPAPLAELSAAVESTGRHVGAFMDLDSGMNRTGIPIGPSAIELYEAISASPGIRPAGLHWYDGQFRQRDLSERRIACASGWDHLVKFRDQLLLSGLSVPTIVAGGTGTFPILAEMDEPGLELSPGTVVYSDAGYRRLFPDLKFVPALGILTRIVSCNRPGFLTLDLGHKACAADPPAGKRLEFPAWPDAEEIQHTEEHLVVKTEHARDQRIGDWTIALPVHVCPTSAVHDFATVVDRGRRIGKWEIYARRRHITI